MRNRLFSVGNQPLAGFAGQVGEGDPNLLGIKVPTDLALDLSTDR